MIENIIEGNDPNTGNILKIVSRIDALFLNGLQMRDKYYAELITELIDGLSSTPYAKYMETNLSLLSNGEFTDNSISALCICRSVLLSSFYDELFDLTNLSIEIIDDKSEINFKVYQNLTLMNSIRKWLKNIALNGFKRLDEGFINSFYQYFDLMEGDVEFRRLYNLLIGYYDELKDGISKKIIPLRRWTDLWMRAYLLTLGIPESKSRKKINGKLYIISAEIFSNANVVTCVWYGFINNRFVTINETEYTIPDMIEDDVWSLFKSKDLFICMEKKIIIEVQEGWISGNNLQLGRYDSGGDFSLNAVFKDLEAKQIKMTKVQEFDRHPKLFAVPIISNCISNIVTIENREIPVNININDNVIFGLLRYENGFSVKPLTSISGETYHYLPTHQRKLSMMKESHLAISSRLLREKTVVKK